MENFLASSLSSPLSDIFFHPPPPSTPSSPTYEVSLMLFTRLSVSWFGVSNLFTCLHICALPDQTGTVSSLLFLFFLRNGILGSAHSTLLPFWLGWGQSTQYSAKMIILNICSCKKAWSITFNHVQNFSGPRSELNFAMWLDLTLAPPPCVCEACQSQIQIKINKSL